MLIIRLVVELGFKHFVQHFDSMALDDSSTSCNLFLLSWCKVSGGFYGVKTYFSVLVVQTKLNDNKNNDLNIAIVSYEYEYEDDDKNDGTPFLYSLLSLTSSFIRCDSISRNGLYTGHYIHTYIRHYVTELKSSSRSGFQAFQTIQRCQER